MSDRTGRGKPGRFYANMGAAIVVAGALGLSGIVMSSPASSTAKIAVLVMSVAGIGFLALTTLADRVADEARSSLYRRAALGCWGLAALALAALMAGAVLGIL
jgi:hypothetical protein